MIFVPAALILAGAVLVLMAQGIAPADRRDE